MATGSKEIKVAAVAAAIGATLTARRDLAPSKVATLRATVQCLRHTGSCEEARSKKRLHSLHGWNYMRDRELASLTYLGARPRVDTSFCTTRKRNTNGIFATRCKIKMPQYFSLRLH